MKLTCFISGILFATAIFLHGSAWSHCEVPCGIYGDEMRLSMIQEHISTIEKAINKIEKLSQTEKHNYNQIVRWVTTKEKHAVAIQDIVCRYFMTQRIKPCSTADSPKHNDYVKKITILHRMLVNAMKAKQSTDSKPVTRLKALLHDFKNLYLMSDKR